MAGILTSLGTVVSPCFRRPGSTGELNEIGEAISLSLKSRSSCYKDRFSIISFVSPYGTRTHFFLVGIKLGAGILTIISSAANIISSKNQFVDIIVLLL